MRSSHSREGVDPDVAAIGPNKADISDMAKGPSSDEENDRSGRPREGEISPAAPRPRFVNPYAGWTNPTEDPNAAIQSRVDAGTAYVGGNGPTAPVNVGASAHAAAQRARYGNLPPAPIEAFEWSVAGQNDVVVGWLESLNGEWYRVDEVARLIVSSGRVEFRTSEPETQPITLANYGPGPEGHERAIEYRRRIAWYIAQCKGAIVEEPTPAD